MKKSVYISKFKMPSVDAASLADPEVQEMLAKIRVMVDEGNAVREENKKAEKELARLKKGVLKVAPKYR
jgi:outer membrane murein-binding lipoprotein Lpp